MSDQNMSKSQMGSTSLLNRPYARTLLMHHFTVPELNLIKYDLGIDQGITSSNSPDSAHFTDLLLYIERRNMVGPFISWLKNHEGEYNFEPDWFKKILEQQYPPPNIKTGSRRPKSGPKAKSQPMSPSSFQIGYQFDKYQVVQILTPHQSKYQLAKFNFALSLWLVLIGRNNNDLYLVELILLIPLL